LPIKDAKELEGKKKVEFIGNWNASRCLLLYAYGRRYAYGIFPLSRVAAPSALEGPLAWNCQAEGGVRGGVLRVSFH